jgi:signal transduction histidine kinase
MKLSYRVTLLIFVVLLTIGVVGGSALLYSERQAATTQFRKTAEIAAMAAYESLGHHMTMHAAQSTSYLLWDHIQDSFRRIAAREPIVGLFLVSADGIVVASADPSEVGGVWTEEQVTRALQLGQRVDSMQANRGSGRLHTIIPVMNQSECRPCHNSGSSEALAAIVINFDSKSLTDYITSQSWMFVLIGGLTLTSVGLALSFVLRAEVVDPLSHIARAATRISQGDFSARTGIGGKNEVGVVARTFDEMTERIEHHATALLTANRVLEVKVQERTQEVQQLAAIRGELLEKVISAQEEERRRIARELHDESAQALTMIMTNIASVRDKLPRSAAELRATLSQSRSLAEQALTEIRNLIHELRPEVLDQLGLVQAIRSYARSRLEVQGIQVRFSVIGLDERLSRRMEIALFRIVQEAITNIARHAGASLVNIELERRDSQVFVRVEDNGRGFEVPAALNYGSGTWGLKGIRERAIILGGEANIDSGTGKGTRLIAVIPLESKV